MVNALKKNLSPLPAAKCGKSTPQCTQRSHQGNQGKTALQAERVRVLGALCSLGSKQKLSGGKRSEMHYRSDKVEEEEIKEYVERETAGAEMQVEVAETAIMQEQEDESNPEHEQSTTTNPDTTFEEMLNAIADSGSDLANSDDEEDVEDEEYGEDTELGKLSEDDEPDWLMGTISKTVLHRMESIRRMLVRLDKLMPQGWGDAANNCPARDMK
jgi:hypothetical protein